ncbi:beta-lactamase family protein [Candidatus Nomurabacteria bacterium]|nr:beta-lactamase family protein [Candidatus Nomurabacteria bacterium]
MKKELTEAIKVAGKIVDNWLPMKIRYDHTPGAVVCIAVNGVPKYVSAFGLSDIGKDIEMKTDAQFRVASMSKMFTAVSIMQLQEKGKLRLDDKVSDYLSWFKGKTKETNLSNITIRQLLSHNAGLFRDGDAQQWVNDKFPTKLEGTVSSKAIVFDNATTMKYSNHGYSILGAVIEKVSGDSYDKYVTENITKPLGLKNTLPDLPDKIPAKLTRGYERWTPDVIDRQKEPNIKTNTYAPATGFISNVQDLALFLSSLHPDSKKSVLNRESRKAMRQVQSIVSKDEMYGLGLCIETVTGQQTYGHSGGFAGYVTNAISHIEDNVQVIVLTNTQSNTAGAVSDNLMRLIYDLKDSKDIKSIPNEPYSGMYRNRWGDMVIVSTGDDLVGFGASASNPVQAWSKYKKVKQHSFKNQDKIGFGTPGEVITFKKVKDGKAQTISSDGADMERVY